MLGYKKLPILVELEIFLKNEVFFRLILSKPMSLSRDVSANTS